MAIAAVNKKINKPAGNSSVLEKIKGLDMNVSFSRGISTRELIFFSSQLSLMIEIGTPLNESLTSIARQIKNPVFKKAITGLVEDVEAGNLLSTSMENYPNLFSEVYVSLIKAGENSGELKEMVDRAVMVQEKQEKFIATLKKAMTYPLILCCVSVAVVVFLLTFVFPRFAVLFEDIKDILPASTKFLLYVSNSIRTSWIYPVLFVGIIAAGAYAFAKSTKGRLIIDTLKMSLPGINQIFVRVYLVQMMRTLGFLMICNVPLMDALLITRRGVNNLVFVKFIDKTARNLEEGQGMSLSFTESAFIPESAKQIVKTGEDTQNISKVMLKLSDYYENEIDDQMRKFTTIIEPLLLIFMGVVVGVIVMSLILPIFKLSKMVH
ncbi:MAG: type II secretion system F family protein [Nitrospiraceae bacterium]|nr:MAG: type II secretion system F family protein [Nitrospiraceae bacterium]